MQSVPITTSASSNPAHLIQHYVIKFVSNLQRLWFSPVSSTNKTDHHDITEILPTVALNTINLNPKPKTTDVDSKQIPTSDAS
jgi:hypothetical protein